MKLRGGHTIRLSHRPSRTVSSPDIPEKLFLSRRLANVHYSATLVAPGRLVDANQPLAISPDHYDMPLLSPFSATVESIDEYQIVLTKLVWRTDIHINTGSDRLDTLFANGCFRYITDAYSGNIAGKASPRAIIVRLTDQDCYVMADDFELIDTPERLVEGLKVLASLGDDLVLYVVVSKKQAKILAELKSILAGVGNIEFVTIPAKYGLDNARLLADKLGYCASDNIWSVPPQGVFAARNVICEGKPSNDLWLSLSGPAINRPQYYNVPVGYPLAELLAGELVEGGAYRVLSGGVLSGRILDTSCQGLAGDTTGVTVLEDSPKREFLKFARFGLDDSRFDDNYSTLLQGELRACVSCGYCQDICPAGLMPDYLHKLLYCDDLDKAEQAGLGRCTGCGLCSFICVSKIELTGQFAEAQVRLREARTDSGVGGCK